MKAIFLGKDKWEKNQDKGHIFWNPSQTINPHLIISGSSGAGKTYSLRKIVEKLAKNGTRIYIFDVHGDLDFDDNICDTIVFSETSKYGINPLKISTDPDYGGVRKKIRNLISILNRTSRKLGSKQESVMINLLRDLYAANGFYEKEPKTWGLDYDPVRNRRFQKKYPTMEDLEKFTNYKLKQLLTGAGSEAYFAINEISKIYTKMKGVIRKEDKEKIGKLKEKYLQACKNFVMNLETGREIDDYIKYDSKDVLKSTYDRIVNLNNIGIFKNKEPNFDNSKPIWRYNIGALSSDEQKIFIDIVLEEIFLKAKEKGISTIPNQFVVIDEAKRFISQEPDHIINVCFNESRKFGLGLILSSQSITHFNMDILQSSATKIILGLDNAFHSQASRMLCINEKKFKYLIPRKTAIVQVKNINDLDNSYKDIILGL